MGSWSVYCAISRITITAGRKAVFLPLRKNVDGVGYDKFIPATLPIFGEYNDYGCIENIEDDENTKFLEAKFGFSAQEICDFLVDGRRDFNSEYSDWKGKENLDVISGWRYMWIDREVWDFLKSYHPDGFGRKGDFDFGNPDILKQFGFEYTGKSKDKRYTDKYELKIGKKTLKVISDGTWCHTEDGKHNIYTLKDLANLGIDVSKFENQEEQNIWRVLDYKTRLQKLGYAIGIDRSYDPDFDFGDIYADFNREKYIERYSKHMSAEEVIGFVDHIEKRIAEKKEVCNISKDYAKLMKDSEYVCDTLADMITIKHNMYAASTSWEPYILYITPQCGEHNQHQKMLEAFANINSKLCIEEENED